jgi:hypothetical protein
MAILNFRKAVLLHLLLLLFVASASFASTSSDSINIIKYKIKLEPNYSSKTINASTKVFFITKIGLNEFSLDLENYLIDSIIEGLNSINYNFTPPRLKINLANSLNIGQLDSIQVFYHGVPYTDATWGGFSFNSVYAFNLGVGFSSNPHNLGKAWFPCLDNFIERSLFEFEIITPIGYKAFCNGSLINHSVNANINETWYWKMNEEIPTYLAGVAIAPYITIRDTFLNIQGTQIPVEIGCLVSDSILCINYFNKLHSTFDLFEQKFGPYPFEKVGYVVVPFGGGAMEHASNIAIGRPFITSNTYESIFPHELSHMWFGDLVTCDNASEMWLNEGWASYSEKLFYEYIYNRSRYDVEVRANHFNVLSKAHIDDGGYFAVSGVPHNITYGSTVYNKGSDAIHTLRAYLEDSLFFSSIKSYLANSKWKSINTTSFKDSIIKYSKVQNIDNFIKDWILVGGFPHFQTGDYFVNDNQLIVKVFVNHANLKHINTNIPVHLKLFYSNFSSIDTAVLLSNGCNSLVLPEAWFLNLECIVLDFNNLLSEAVTDENIIIKTPANYVFNEAKLAIKVLQQFDSTYLNIAHHWIRPENFKQPILGFHLANRFWTIKGVAINKLHGNITFSFNGGVSNSYLDKDFITNVEDSIRILWRKNSSMDWQILNNAVINFLGNNNNKSGNIMIDSIKAGEYTLGIYDHSWVDTSVNFQFMEFNCFNNSNSELKDLLKDDIEIVPNPSATKLNVRINILAEKEWYLSVYDGLGKSKINKIKFLGSNLTIDVEAFKNGNYYLVIENNTRKISKVFNISH